MNERRKTIQFEPGGELRLSAVGENLALSSWDQDQMEIRARVLEPERISEERARRALEAARIEVGNRGRTLRVVCGSGGSVPLLFEIFVPRRAAVVDIETERGHLEGRGLEGSLRLRSSSGSCRLTGFRGSFDIEIGRGEVLIDAVQLLGRSRIETGSGNADLRIAKAQGLKVQTKDVRLLRSLTIEAILGNGSAEVFARTRRGRVRLFRDGELMGTLRRGGELQWRRPEPREIDWLRELVRLVQGIRL
jgi:hypothetical protein